MDKLQWFKFSPSSWMMGRIQRCSDDLQGKFIRLCCAYWNHKCKLELDDAKIELTEDGFLELIRLKIIKSDGHYISIDFLDDQFLDIEFISEKRSEQGAIGNLKRWHKPTYDKFIKGELDLQTALSIAKGSPPDRPPIANASLSIAEEKRIEEKRIEERRKEDTKNEVWFIGWFNSSMTELKGSGKYKLNKKVKDQLHARIKEGYKSEAFIHAFKAISKDQYHSDKGFKYLTPEFITRTDKLELWSNAAVEKLEEEKGKGSGGVSMEELYNS